MTGLGSVLRAPVSVRRRRIVAWSITCLFIAGLLVATVSLGDAPIPPADALSALFGGGSGGTRLIVVGWRLPRGILAIAIGAMLALSGALFQAVTRNPLGSPDILGFSAGAMTGALLVITAGSAGILALASGAVAGGLIAAAVVFGLAAWRGTGGFALIIAGIGVTAMIGALNVMIQLSSDKLVAHAAAIWGAGSLNGIGGEWVAPIVLTGVVCAALSSLLAPGLALHELGDERAAALGVRPGALRLAAMVVGVLLVAICTAAAGPIAFIALAAPQIARRVWRTGTIPLAASAAAGAVLLQASDLVAMRAFAPTIVPTGLVTICLGGAYLAWLLSTSERRSR